MAEKNDIVRLAVDTYKGSVEKYSTKDSLKTLHEALVEANNGSTTLDVRAIRDGKCNGLFSIIEEVLDLTVSDNLQNHAFLNSMVDFRNVPLGDKNEFVIEKDDLFYVARAADGTQAIRRQRPSGYQPLQIPTEFRVVKIYEELNRILAGRVDFNQMINRVSDSFAFQMLNDVYAMWEAITATDLGGAAYYVSGAYDEDQMLALIAHVEAESKGQATVVGTKVALRNLAPAMTDLVSRSEAPNDMYNYGYVGKFYGTPCVALPQRHILNTTNFMLSDKVLTVVAASTDKAIKVVYEGNPLIIPGDMYKNQDLTQDLEYAYAA